MDIKTIEIEKEHILTGIGYSSKGNQLKWEIDGYWHKADALGFESLAEIIVSRLMRYSNIKGYVNYDPVTIIYKGKSYRAAGAKIFEGKKKSW